MEKKEKKGKKLLDEIKDEFKRHTNVLMEEMRSTVKLVTEQHSSVIERLDRIEAKLEKHDQDLFTIKSELGTVKLAIKDVDARLEEKLAEYERRLKKLEAV